MAKILVIDDEYEFIESMKDCLEQEGYEVCVACDGEIALSVFEKEQPDLVITDIIMPQSDGIEVIYNFKHNYPNLKVKIIAMSGGGKINGMEYLRYAKRLGADGVFEKPINLDAMLKKIKQLLLS